MNAHDPLCSTKFAGAPCRECGRIATIRADERERHHDGGDCECTSVYADETWLHAQRDRRQALADLRAKVEAAASDLGWMFRFEILALIDSLNVTESSEQ